MSRFDKVHHYVTIPGTNDVRMTKVTPYIRVSQGDDTPYFLQNGVFFAAEGDRFDDEDVPEWAWFQAGMCTDKILTEAGCRADRIEQIRERGGVTMVDRRGNPKRVQGRAVREGTKISLRPQAA